ncbi:GspH/FimT family pseudopilin [Stutzerimonas balearica]|uniref:GspH/FimT family pseudopilin n=1 Tax=Stutzerimonas balearica TaxID=74829 RepID=UPI0007747C43|nr:GspH/FimT family pseudopilin [Stutzerimonas balearica]MBD3734939.1 GspH/FimT family pseudopilin [Stutzerimonas balearica]MBK3747117.1 prepilin-type N-terminal cleavage/methylation domain-containing protein [Stutzerimonas balearica]MBK3825314.1 prepilin-type N-terminal cleavage/methylation domain-containing protein [Stutzerimonas balearica]MBK3855005.1 prepilin-type N-terminal cleavage/methylation domain-containing protein [Stutzerimonas balearica]MBS4149558.1 prepilin-type N-terminal cleava
MSRRSDMHGFTLIELMITLALLTIAVSIAVPNFTFLVQKTRLQGKADDLVRLLQYARGEAVTRRTTATITVDDDGPWILRVGSDERQLEHIPSQAQLLADVTQITFRPNGTASPAVITLCRESDPETGFVVEVQPSGAPRLHPRGEDTDGSVLTSCTP